MTFSQFEQPAVSQPSQRRQADLAMQRFAKAVRAEAAYLQALFATTNRMRRATGSPARGPVSRQRQ